jgi:uncharacterized protein YutE (UPF0331/DUF86 family)
VQKIVYCCDKCGAEKGPISKIAMFAERIYNGVDCEDMYYTWDLCHACCVKILKAIISKVEKSGPAIDDSAARKMEFDGVIMKESLKEILDKNNVHTG